MIQTYPKDDTDRHLWTEFRDNNTGGQGQKTDYRYIFIQAPCTLAIAIFKEMLGRNPEHSSCHCCGQDFSIQEGDSLEELTQWGRGVEIKDGVEIPYPDYHGEYHTIGLTEYCLQPDILVINTREV